MKPTSSGQLSFIRPYKPLLIVLSGPSGAGKDAVLYRMKVSGYALKYVITATTRQQRPNETNGMDYYFVTVEQFHDMLQKSELLEWAEVYGHWYGIPKAEVRKALDMGQDVIVKIDVQGAATIKKMIPNAVFIFLVSTSKDDLALRLRQRHTESSADMALRLNAADDEMNQISRFDYVVVNHWDKIDQAVADIIGIIRAEKCRVVPREITL
ncbi:MAG: guanylate kinase [Dehalococcoidales bacterium]|nr:guanylate kinase [Dehalococcoidales bacterium]